MAEETAHATNVLRVDEVFSGARECDCLLCQRMRAIKRIAALLPVVEAKELQDIFESMLDESEEASMKIAHLESQLETKS